MKKIILFLCFSFLMCVPVSADLILNFNGDEGDTSYIAETGQSVAIIGGGAIDTVEYLHGGASLLLPGSPNQAIVENVAVSDFDLINSEFTTLSFRVKHGVLDPPAQVYIAQGQSQNNGWSVSHIRGQGIQVLVKYANVVYSQIFPSSASYISDNEWHWIVVSKDGNQLALYLDGQQVGYSAISADATWDYSLSVGSGVLNENGFSGNIDSVQIAFENLFGANADSLLTDNIVDSMIEPSAVVPSPYDNPFHEVFMGSGLPDFILSATMIVGTVGVGALSIWAILLGVVKFKAAVSIGS